MCRMITKPPRRRSGFGWELVENTTTPFAAANIGCPSLAALLPLRRKSAPVCCHNESGAALIFRSRAFTTLPNSLELIHAPPLVDLTGQENRSAELFGISEQSMPSSGVPAEGFPDPAWTPTVTRDAIAATAISFFTSTPIPEVFRLDLPIRETAWHLVRLAQALFSFPAYRIPHSAFVTLVS